MNSLTKLLFVCYLIFSPTVLSFKLPSLLTPKVIEEETDDIDRQGLQFSDYDQFGQPIVSERQDLELPENLLPVAAVGFLAGLVGVGLNGMAAATTTTTTTTAATTSTTTTTTTTAASGK